MMTGTERYIEVHVWSDEVIGRYLREGCPGKQLGCHKIGN